MNNDMEKQIKIFIAGELAAGRSLSEIQNLVNDRFDQRMTYMDIRIMASSLDVDWKSLDPNAAKKSADTEEAPAADQDTEADVKDGATAAEESDAAENNSTVVDVSPIARPGMMFSGSVKFASGSTAEWYVDNMGRLGLENLCGEKPSQQDIEEFQLELNKAVSKAMGRG